MFENTEISVKLKSYQNLIKMASNFGDEIRFKGFESNYNLRGKLRAIHWIGSIQCLFPKVQFSQEIGVCLRILQQIKISVGSNREQATAAQQRGLVIRGKFLRFV